MQRSRATTQVATGQFGDITWSPRGDRLAFIREGEKPDVTHIWTVPVDPNTGKIRGAGRRVSDRAGDEPAFSHDGRQIAFAMDSDREPHGQDLGIVATAGGPARSLYQSTGGIGSISWTPDGKSIFFETDLKGGHSLLRIAAAGGTADVVQTDGEAWPGVDPTGKWSCETYTVGGQLVGLRKFEVLGEGSATPKTTTPTPDAGVGVDGKPSD